MLIPNTWLTDDALVIVVSAIKSLIVLVNDKLRTTKILIQLLQGLISALMIAIILKFALRAWYHIDIQNHTVDLVHASNL